MHRSDLSNGITMWYESDASGSVILRYPDGSQVRTTWNRLGMIEAVVDRLREAYECLLLQAVGDGTAPTPPVEKLVQLDDLLFALGERGPGAGRPEAWAASSNRSPVF